MSDTLTRERREELEAELMDVSDDRTVLLSVAEALDLLTALRRLGELEEILDSLNEGLATYDAVKRNADRYQWLRHGDNDTIVTVDPDNGGQAFLLRAERLDEAIDKEIASEKGAVHVIATEGAAP